MGLKIKNIILLLLFTVPSLQYVNAQEKLLSVHHEQVSIRTVLDDIEAQSGLIFAYNSQLFNDSKRITVHADSVGVEQLLQVIFREKNFQFIKMDKQLIIKAVDEQDISVPDTETVRRMDNKYTVSGFVRDAVSGEVLIGATVVLSDLKTGAISSHYGFYSITVRDSFDSLFCSYLGYQSESVSLTGNDQKIDFFLLKDKQQIEELVIYADEMAESLRSTRSSSQKIDPSTATQMPALLGEKDVIKALASVPGVKFMGDGSTIFYVRGGSRDQNLITLDDAPVYNPMHLMGFFSTIVPDAIKSIELYKGEFPVSYGGRLSSLVDIRTKDGDMQKFSMRGSFGLLSARLSLEGPLWKDHISYFISGRRSYFLRPLQTVNDDIGDLHFADLHFKINYRINSRNRIYLSLYKSTDNFESSSRAGNISGINWQNTTSTFRWNHLFSDRLFSNTTLYASSYDYYLYTNLTNGDYWNSHIDNFSLKSDFTWYIAPSHTLRFGAKLARHFMNPGNFYSGDQLLPLPYEISTRNVFESNAYISDQLILFDKLSVRMGIRLTSWNNIGPAVEYSYGDLQLDSIHYSAGENYHTYLTGDPRIGITFKLNNNRMLKLSYSRMSQFEQLITNSISPFSSLEVWLPSGPAIKPQRADQFTLGYSREKAGSGWTTSAEIYYRKMHNQIDYRDHAKLLMNPFIERELRFGEGIAYGVETLIARSSSRINSWLSYTYSRSMLSIGGINNNNPYPAYGDRPHDLSLFFSYSINPRLEISANFKYMTGSPFTAPTAFYFHDNIQVPIYFKRNNERLPDYHRLDLSLSWDFRKKESNFDHGMIFSVYNLYGRKNPVLIHFNKIETNSGDLVTPYNYYTKPELVPTQFYLFRFMPSLSYQFSF